MAGNSSLLQKAILTDAYGNELSYREDFNIIYLSISQIQASLAPPSADPQGYWHECALNHGKCTSTQIEFLQGEFRFGLEQEVMKYASTVDPLIMLICFCVSNRVQGPNAERGKRFL